MDYQHGNAVVFSSKNTLCLGNLLQSLTQMQSVSFATPVVPEPRAIIEKRGLDGTTRRATFSWMLQGDRVPRGATLLSSKTCVTRERGLFERLRIFGRDRQFSRSDNVAEVVNFRLEEFTFLQLQ